MSQPNAATGPRWQEVLSDKFLTACGKECSTRDELALEVGRRIKQRVTADALCNAVRRWRDELDLRSLGEYLGKRREVQRAVRPEDIAFPLNDARRKELSAAKVLVVTSALNNVGVDDDAWSSLKRYAAERSAAIVVVPSRYRNPTTPGESNRNSRDAWWPAELVPFMTDDLIQLHEHLYLMAHVRVQATSVNPTGGLEALSRSASAIFGHSQLSLQMVPAPQNRLPKALWTTGSVSQRRHSQTRAGVRADFHHGLGGLVVELDGPRFYVRPLVVDADGGFYDLDRYYHPRGSRKSPGASALVTGDEHAIFADPAVVAATYTGAGSICKILRPAKVVRHDVLDSYSISHHGRRDAVKQVAKHKLGLNDLASELAITLKHVRSTAPANAENVIVSSNHHDHLLRWLSETTPLDEPWNAETWVELWGAIVASLKRTETGYTHADPMAAYFAARSAATATKIRFLGSDEEELVEGVSISHHGHRGPNGVRGSIRNMSRIGVRSVIAHSHTPGIYQGCWQVGTSSYLRLEYTKGSPSSHAHAHCAIHPNGKRQMIFVIDGHWRLTE